MQFCMIEKLKEMGIDPQSTRFEWSLEQTPAGEIWTYTAYWGEHREVPLKVAHPLANTDLIICARANANRGLEVVSSLCGYGKDINSFQKALKQAGQYLGVKVESFQDLQQDFKSVDYHSSFSRMAS